MRAVTDRFRPLAAGAVALVILTFFLSRSWAGLFVDFQPDDWMNLYFAWAVEPGRLLLANLTPFTTEYRPAGAVLYRLVFAAGLDPFPFRVVAYALMACNAWLVFALGKAVARSTETGILAALFASYHPRMRDLYLNNGTIYDVLCTSFYLLALWRYVRLRQCGDRFNAWRTAQLVALAVLAFNSKEMALTLPLALLAYESVFHRPPRQPWTRWLRAWLGNTAVIWAIAGIAVVTVVIKTGQGSSFAGVRDYTLVLSAERYFETTCLMLGELLYLGWDAVRPVEAALLYGALLGAGLLLRSRVLTFGSLFVVAAPLPINFIVPRGLFVMYLPLAGWAIYAAHLLVVAKDGLVRRLGGPLLSRRPAQAAALALFLLVASGLWAVQAADSAHLQRLARQDRERNAAAQLRDRMAKLHPQLKRGSRLLFLDDPFEPGSWTPLFVLRLLYRDKDLVLHRTKMGQGPPRGAAIAGYDYVFTYGAGVLRELPSDGALVVPAGK